MGEAYRRLAGIFRRDGKGLPEDAEGAGQTPIGSGQTRIDVGKTRIGAGATPIESGEPPIDAGRPPRGPVPCELDDLKLYEYRCTYPMRVIARWIDPTPEEPTGSILLVAATLSHDHERLQEVIRRKRQDLAAYRP